MGSCLGRSKRDADTPAARDSPAEPGAQHGFQVERPESGVAHPLASPVGEAHPLASPVGPVADMMQHAPSAGGYPYPNAERDDGGYPYPIDEHDDSAVVDHAFGRLGDPDMEPEWVRDQYREQDRAELLGDIAGLPVTFQAGGNDDAIAGHVDVEIDPVATPGSLAVNNRLRWMPADKGWAESGPSMRDVYTQSLEARPDLSVGWGPHPEGRALDLPYSRQRADPAPVAYTEGRMRVFPDGVRGGPNPGAVASAPPSWRKRYISDLPAYGSRASSCLKDSELLTPLLGGDPGSGTRLLMRGSAVRVLPHSGEHRLSLATALSEAPASGIIRHAGMSRTTGKPQGYRDPAELLTPLPGFSNGLNQLRHGSREGASQPWRRPHQLLPDAAARAAVRPPFVVPSTSDPMPLPTRQEQPPPEPDASRQRNASEDDYYDYYGEEEEEEEY